MMKRETEMTKFEAEVRAMLTDKENEMLDRCLSQTSARDGMIATLVARSLRQMDKNGLLVVYAD